MLLTEAPIDVWKSKNQSVPNTPPETLNILDGDGYADVSREAKETLEGLKAKQLAEAIIMEKATKSYLIMFLK